MGIREATLNDAAGIARVHVESWRSTYKGIMPDDVLANLSVEQRTQARREQMLSGNAARIPTFVAEAESGEIVGFVIGGSARDQIEGFDSELYAIYLLESAQGQGYGRVLMTTLARRLYQDGFHAMLLWVLADNRIGRRFYEAAGGERIAGTDKVFTIGGVELCEIAYGWRDLSRF